MLDAKLSKYIRITKKHTPALKRLGIETVRDLLYHFPVRYSDVAVSKVIEKLESGESATIYGHIHDLKSKKSWTSKKPMTEARLTDIQGNTIKVIWFHQPYIAKMLHEDQVVKLTGQISVRSGTMSLMNPEIEKLPELPIDTHESLFKETSSDQEYAETLGFPIYRETRGITSKWMYHAVTKLLAHEDIQQIHDHIPEYLLEKYYLPGLATALVWVHMPKNARDAESAKKRFAFEEMFTIQLQKQQSRHRYNQLYQEDIVLDRSAIQAFIDRFPFTLTGAQSRVIADIIDDLEKPDPMSRLIEGDVGSGKTAVAAVATYSVATTRPNKAITEKQIADKQAFGNLQIAYMAPTEVLAAQLFENFIGYFAHTGLSIVLMTGKTCRKYPSKVDPQGWTDVSKAQAKKWITNGEIPIIIGTHALISKSVSFKHLSLVIVDEQHRFGTRQRMELANKNGNAPHYISMTATPIPRTLALTIYGDLDLSVIDHMPPGRKQVISEIVDDSKREEVYIKIHAALEAGRQAYVICPRIFNPNKDQAMSEQEWRELSPAKRRALRLKSVEAEAERLGNEIFGDYTIGMLHSKMTKVEKEETMGKFKNHEIDILVATSVIEVGVSVANATMIIIEGAERYGLAQLHQLRGRVLRSSHQAYCWLFADIKSDVTQDRLSALVEAKNGFELAEYDLMLRGSGDLAGGKQWGMSDLAMEAIKNRKLVEAARTEAKHLITNDPELESYPELDEQMKKRVSEVHFE